MGKTVVNVIEKFSGEREAEKIFLSLLCNDNMLFEVFDQLKIEEGKEYE